MSLADQLAQAISTMEGFWLPNSRANRNNNPGNLRAGSGQSGTDAAGYAIFPDLETGWNALYRQISLDAARGLNLGQFIGKYAPPSENNTSNYLSYVAGQLGVSPDTPLANLGAGDPGNPPRAPQPRRAGGPMRKASLPASTPAEAAD